MDARGHKDDFPLEYNRKLKRHKTTRITGMRLIVDVNYLIAIICDIQRVHGFINFFLEVPPVVTAYVFQLYDVHHVKCFKVEKHTRENTTEINSKRVIRP